jgi:hypothetical protein
MIGRQLLATVLTGLLAVPAWAGAEPAVGTAGPSVAATVRGSSIAPDTPLFSGDVVDVSARGSAALNFGHGSTVQLGEKSTLRIEKGDNHVAFELLRGRATFCSSEEFPVEAHLTGIRIRSASGGTAAGKVVFRSSRVVAIAAEHGNLLILATRDSRNVSLHEGESMEMRLDAPQSSSGAAVQGTSPVVSHHNWLTATIIAGAVGIGVGFAVARGEGGLSTQQKQNLVSPFVFPPR